MSEDVITKTRDYFTGKLSDGVRQLDLAGIGIIWIIRTGGADAAAIPFGRFLLLPLLCLTLSLACDLLHYGYGSYVWDKEAKKAVRDLTPERSTELGRLARRFFWAKAWLCGIGLSALIIYLGLRLFGC